MSKMMNSKKGKRNSGRPEPRRRGSDRRDFDHRSSERRDSGRREFSRDRRDSGSMEFGRDNSNRREFKRRDFSDRKPALEMTKVTCASCGEKCEVPFKPSSNKPVYCRDCFTNNNDSNNDRRSFNRFDKHPKNRSSSNNISENDLDLINEKLNKIMKALDIR